tara:strand:+ start:246 stop:488 length:243 start_codon:yes stop_codon:yes gene_type:complete
MTKKKKPATTTEIWEVWTEDHYIKGKLLKTFKSKDAAIKYAKKNIKYKYLAPDRENGRKKKEFYFEDEDRRPIGMLIKRP